jgi:hypothetical protein
MSKVSKTNDEILSFSLGFDKSKDAQVFVRDEDTGDEVQLAADLEQIDEVIKILQDIKVDALKGPRPGYELENEAEDESEEDEEEAEEETDEDEEEEADEDEDEEVAED